MLRPYLGIPLFCFVAACPSHAYAYDGGRNIPSTAKIHSATADPVAGKITDASGNPLQGVTVTVKGSR